MRSQELNLAQHYREQGLLNEAIKVCGRDIGILEDAFGSTDPFVFILKSKHAQLLRDAGRLSDAVALDQQVIENAEKLGDSGHELMLPRTTESEAS